VARLAERNPLGAPIPQSVRRPYSVKKWLAAGITCLLLIAAFAAVAPALSRMTRSRIQGALEDRFASDLQIQNLKVSLFPSVTVTGDSVIFRLKKHPDDPPLIQIAKFSARGNILSLLARHIGMVRLEGLSIHVPPKDPGSANVTAGSQSSPYFVIDEIIADGTTLSTIPRDASKVPLVFDIKRLHMRGGGSNSPFAFDAILTNAKPPGEINSKGKFGPWNMGRAWRHSCVGNLHLSECGPWRLQRH
jgi:hypothetical protein